MWLRKGSDQIGPCEPFQELAFNWVKWELREGVEQKNDIAELLPGSLTAVMRTDCGRCRQRAGCGRRSARKLPY